MNIDIDNRWDELEPEVQLSLIRLINKLASMGSAKTDNQIRKIECEQTDDYEFTITSMYKAKQFL